MRLFLIGGLTSGIALTLLAISIVLADMVTAFYAYLGAVICVCIVIVCAAVNSLTTWGGWVNPDDRLWSNILAYLLTVFVILAYGRFVSTEAWLLNILFNTGSMLVQALILLFGLVGLSGAFQLKQVLEGTEPDEKSKEISARLMLFSLLVGGFMAAVQLALYQIYWWFFDVMAFGLPQAYYYVAMVIGGLAFILVITLGVVLRSKYEPVGGSK